jgi:LAS superfamily LD-carboxypeptidase LdcB
MNPSPSPARITFVLFLLCVVAGIGYGMYYLYTSLQDTEKRLAAEQATLASTTAALTQSMERADSLEQSLLNERAQNATYETQLGIVTSKVGNLTKLIKTDKELLQKYSKVYFLNENYAPAALATISPSFTINPTKTYSIHSEVHPFLEQLLTDAQTAGAPLVVLSSFRSFSEQANLKSAYRVTYGSGANRFSADQGYSEHQLGTAVDFTTTSLKTTSTSFATTPGGKWLQENAYKYGFILSYPKNNSYYMYEPWHWRFVGVGLATYLHTNGGTFYSLDQRYIDTYLVDLFDK